VLTCLTGTERLTSLAKYKVRGGVLKGAAFCEYLLCCTLLSLLGTPVKGFPVATDINTRLFMGLDLPWSSQRESTLMTGLVSVDRRHQ